MPARASDIPRAFDLEQRCNSYRTVRAGVDSFRIKRTVNRVALPVQGLLSL